MKIGLCACYETFNYGSQLQCYASLEILKNLGVEVELIKYKKELTPIFILKSLPRLFNAGFIKRRTKILRNEFFRRTNPNYAHVLKNRDYQFGTFIQKSFREYESISVGFNQLKRNARKYDVVIVGSDQLWLPSGMGSNFYNLLFVPDDIKKVSFATSFGVSSIPFYQRKRTARYLSNIDKISVRECAGKQIVENLTNKVATVIIDPTLMLTTGQWGEKIGDRIVHGDYIFCYFLGNNHEYRRLIKEFADGNELQVYTLAHIDEYVESDEEFINVEDVGPFEFINLIRYAKYIFTDSFHGSVFSILFKKKFLVFNRFDNNDINSRNSRIDNLTQMFELEERRYKGNLNQIYKEIDYDIVFEKLEMERIKAKSFITDALLR